MSIFAPSPGTLFRFPPRRGNGQATRQHGELAAQLQAALVREQVLEEDKRLLSQQQVLMVQEFEHRLVNGLQLISSLLTLQSRTATPEAAAQLDVAARRVAAFGRVHRRLHLLDHQKYVEFKQYLQLLCDDLSGLLFQQGAGCAIMVEGADAEIPTALGIPLGLIVNELITNAAKYASGSIFVRFETTSPGHYALSVLDDGPGMPAGFDSTQSKGLGMRIVMSLVRQIGGNLHIAAIESGHGTRFTVEFCFPGTGAAVV